MKYAFQFANVNDFLTWSFAIFQQSNGKEEKAYNNAFEMMPAFGMLHKASSGFMSGVTLQAAQDLANKGQDNKAMDAINEG